MNHSYHKLVAMAFIPWSSSRLVNSLFGLCVGRIGGGGEVKIEIAMSGKGGGGRVSIARECKTQYRKC